MGALSLAAVLMEALFALAVPCRQMEALALEAVLFKYRGLATS